jgi:hypothetical protein
LVPKNLAGAMSAIGPERFPRIDRNLVALDCS